jgi:hypothetical protein
MMDTAGPSTRTEPAPFALAPLPPKWATPEEGRAWFAEHAGGHDYAGNGCCRNAGCGVHFLDATGRCAGPKPC